MLIRCCLETGTLAFIFFQVFLGFFLIFKYLLFFVPFSWDLRFRLISFVFLTYFIIRLPLNSRSKMNRFRCDSDCTMKREFPFLLKMPFSSWTSTEQWIPQPHRHLSYARPHRLLWNPQGLCPGHPRNPCKTLQISSPQKTPHIFNSDSTYLLTSLPWNASLIDGRVVCCLNKGYQILSGSLNFTLFSVAKVYFWKSTLSTNDRIWKLQFVYHNSEISVTECGLKYNLWGNVLSFLPLIQQEWKSSHMTECWFFCVFI